MKLLTRTACLLLAIISLTLTGCLAPTAGLLPYTDVKDGYSFLYPNGWVQTSLKGGPDVLFHDLIEQTENVSVTISALTSVRELAELGDANAIGHHIQERAIAPPASGKVAQLLSAQQREVNGKTYYTLEYAVERPGSEPRHDLISVINQRDKVYTLSISTLESRWDKVKDLFTRVANSFAVN